MYSPAEATKGILKLCESDKLNQENLLEICNYLFSPKNNLDISLLSPRQRFLKTLLKLDSNSTTTLLPFFLLKFITAPRTAKSQSYLHLLQSYLSYYFPPAECPDNIYTEDRSRDLYGASIQTLCEFIIQNMASHYADINTPSSTHKASCLKVLTSHFSHKLDPRPSAIPHPFVAGQEATFDRTLATALSILRPRLYDFLKINLSNTNNTTLYLTVIDTWISWMTPWGSRSSPSPSYTPVISENLPFYTSLLVSFISTPTHFTKLLTPPTPDTIPLHERGKAQLDAYDRVLCVYTETRDLRELLVSIEESVLEIQGQGLAHPFTGLLNGEEYIPVLMPDGGGIRQHVLLVMTQINNCVAALETRSDSPFTSPTPPSRPFEGSPIVDWVMYGVRGLWFWSMVIYAYVYSSISTGRLGSPYDSVTMRHQILKKMKDVHVLLSCIWWEVSPISSDFSTHPSTLTAYKRRTPQTQFDIVGDRVVIMSYESRILVSGFLWVEKKFREKFGIQIKVRWLADLRNVWFFVGMVAVVWGICVMFSGEKVRVSGSTKRKVWN